MQLNGEKEPSAEHKAACDLLKAEIDAGTKTVADAEAAGCKPPRKDGQGSESFVQLNGDDNKEACKDLKA